jgi:hypothetical protein
MNAPFEAPLAPRKRWHRVLLMLLLAFAFQLGAWVLFLAAVIQLILLLVTGETNPRLSGFGRSLGRYLGQIADFETFGTEALPFPFADWPDRAETGATAP